VPSAGLNFGGAAGGALVFSRILLNIAGNVCGFTLGASKTAGGFFLPLIRGVFHSDLTLPDILSTGAADESLLFADTGAVRS